MSTIASAQPAPASVDNDATLTFAPSAFVQPAGWPVLSHAEKASEHLGPGVEFERWRVATAMGPLTLSIVRAQLRNPYVRLAVGSRNDAVIGPGEALTSIANRRAAIAGINADYYDISGNGAPTNLLLQNGIVQHAPNGRAALLISEGNQIAFGPISWRATITAANGSSVSVDEVNDWSAATQLMLFTQRFGLPGPANADAEVVLTPMAGQSYRVSNAGPHQPTFLPLAPDDLGIAAHADAALTLLELFHVGDVVTVSQAWTPVVAGLVEGVGGGPVLLRGGQPYEDPNAPAPEERDVRYPLTGAGVTGDGATLLLVTVDGRAPGRSIGVTRPMLAALLASLGASDAMAFDSGGSTEMVIRRLGDTQVSVANVPSDGRERSIADGLFVINSASPGPATQLVVRAPARAILTGSHLEVTAQPVDANDQPVGADQPVELSISPTTAATITQHGVIEALRPATIVVHARSASASGELTLRVVSQIARLRIGPLSRAYAYETTVALAVNAALEDGGAIAVDPAAVSWSATGDAGTLDHENIFHTAKQPSLSRLIARVGGVRAESKIVVGAHKTMLQEALSPGDTPKLWHLVTAPKGLTALLDIGKSPDGVAALHLSYDFGAGPGTRAAMVETSFPVPGEPLAITVDIYGDGSGAWLRGAYRNGDGISDTLTFARRLDWKGWRTVGATLPPRVRFPIVWTRVYVVAPPGESQAGDIWLRNLTAWYPGPTVLQR